MNKKKSAEEAGIEIDLLYSISVCSVHLSIPAHQFGWDDVEGIAYVIKFDWFSHMEHITEWELLPLRTATHTCTLYFSLSHKYIYLIKEMPSIFLLPKWKKNMRTTIQKDIRIFFQN